jgi:AAA family ATP:ADP antiporter
VDNSEQTRSSGIAYKLLKIFTDIKPGEALVAVLLMLNVFLLLAAYYILKPFRDSLMLEEWSAEMKSYLSAAIAVLLIFVVKIFSRIASCVPRQKLIAWVTLFFISNIVIFYVLHLAGVGAGLMGIVFFIWMGIFNLIVIAQFWGFANDLYSEDQGKRLFPLIAFGATFGGFAGGKITNWLMAPLGRYSLLLVAAVLLAICIFMTWIIHRKDLQQAEPTADAATEVQTKSIEKEKPLEAGGAFKLVFKKKYLLYIAFFVLLLNFINTNGVYMLDTVAKKTAESAIAAGTADGLDMGSFMNQFFAGFYNIMNLFAMSVQLFVVSRIFKWFGVRVAIFFLPLLAFGGYFLISLGATLFLVKWVKALENGLDYSLMNTTRSALYLVTSRQEKYKAQAVTKTFFHRSGDVLSAALVFLGSTYFAFKVENFAFVNVLLVLIWLILGVLIFKEHKSLFAKKTITG